MYNVTLEKNKSLYNYGAAIYFNIFKSFTSNYVNFIGNEAELYASAIFIEEFTNNSS